MQQSSAVDLLSWIQQTPMNDKLGDLKCNSRFYQEIKMQFQNPNNCHVYTNLSIFLEIDNIIMTQAQTYFVSRYRKESNSVPGKMGPICSERTVGPRAQSLLIGSHNTEIKKPMSPSESMYEEVEALLISLCVPSELVCKEIFLINQLFY